MDGCEDIHVLYNSHIIVDNTDHSVITDFLGGTGTGRKYVCSLQKTSEIILLDLAASAVRSYHCSQSYIRHLVTHPPVLFIRAGMPIVSLL
jgi:hypothetical protein